MPSSPSSASIFHLLWAITVVAFVGCVAKTLPVGSNDAGACGHCALPNAISTCDVNGACAIQACFAGFFDCNNDPHDGCEINGNIDYNHCGVSSVACTMSCAFLLTDVTSADVVSLKCSSGQCVVDQCAPGWKDCDTAVTNGCEKNVLGNTCGSDRMSPCCGLCNGCPAGQTCDSTTNRCGSGAPSDGGNDEGSGNSDAGGNTGVDASLDVQPPPAPPGLAGFAFVVNGVVQSPTTCPSDNWEFFAPPLTMTHPGSDGGPVQDDCNYPPPCPGITSVILINTGQVPMAYIAHAGWNGAGYRPGVATGEQYELVGVLSPSAQVDITSVYTGAYTGGTVAVLGSANPFSYPDAGKYLSDEGVVPWPAGVSGSGGAAQMQVAEIEVRNACGKANAVW